MNPEIEAIGARSKEKAGGFPIAVARTERWHSDKALFTLSTNSDSSTEGLLELQTQMRPSLISSAKIVEKSLFKPLVSLYISLFKALVSLYISFLR